MVKRTVLLVTFVLTLGSLSCQVSEEPAPIRPFILFGVDGADWQVIEWMWQQDRLPHLKQLADRGVAAPLETFHHASPVIWTTVATGRMPDVHGITEFVVPTGKGDQPVSSSLRRVPALWNMVTASGGRIAVIGWWASWPVEEVEGIMISDRAVHDIPDRVWPREYESTFDAKLAQLREQGIDVQTDSMLEADRVYGRTAAQLAGEEFDLMLLYLRGVDISCHFHWRAFEPSAFPELEVSDLEAEREKIAREYEFVDTTLGHLLSAAGPDINIIVMSDHGFDAMDGETTHIRLNFDVVLEDLGFLTRTDSGVDFTRSRLHSYASPERSLVKKIRFARAGREEGGRVSDSDETAIRNRLEVALEKVTFRGGSPAFVVRDATAKETQQGADFVVEVLTEGAGKPLKVDGVPLRGAIRSIDRLSGTHGRNTPGIFVGDRYPADGVARDRSAGGRRFRGSNDDRDLHRRISGGSSSADHSDLGRTHRG
jgi:predicted AlkP superfamily phosphohydrolase/phosphomutase